MTFITLRNWSLGFDFKIMFLTVFKGFINKMHIDMHDVCVKNAPAF